MPNEKRRHGQTADATPDHAPTGSKPGAGRRDRRDAGAPKPHASKSEAPATLASAFDLQQRSASVAKAVAAVRSMRLPFPPQIAAMGDMWETMETGRMLRGGKQIGSLFLDPTGCGKTTAAEALAEIACADDEDGIVSVVHCRLPANGTAIGLYGNALARLGDGYMNQSRENRMLSALIERLEESETRLLVIDECQHGADSSGIGGQIAAAIKLLLDTGTVPVAILGTEKAVEVLAKDKELAGRLAAPSSLAPLNWSDEEDQATWTDLLRTLDAQLKADRICTGVFGLDDPTIAEKLAETCNGTIGQLMGMTRTAVREMVRDKRKRLTMEDVVYAIDAWNVAFGFVGHNPFRTE